MSVTPLSPRDPAAKHPAGRGPEGVRCWAPDGVGEVRPGDDIADLIHRVASPLQAGDIVVVASKIVAKAEDRLIDAADREQAITDETVRVVATRRQPGGGLTRIVENRLGIIGAAAGVDASNVPDGTVLLLPEDPDASAARICTALRQRTGVLLGVVISDTLGRAWRVGQTDVAIGAAGISVIDDLRGTRDSSGRVLDVTMMAVADEIASLADLVKGKASGRPIAVVRGLGHLVRPEDGPGARTLVRPGGEDMFRRGADEAYDDGYRDGYAEGSRETNSYDGDREETGVDA